MQEREFEFIILLTIITVFICLIIYEMIREQKQKELDSLEKEEMRKRKEYEKKWRKINREEWNKKIQSTFNSDDIKQKYQPNKKIKALVGDYYELTANNTNFMLKSVGVETEFVPSAKDIVDKIDEGELYDVIITNNIYRYGEMGSHVLDELKGREGFNTPIVILTVDQDARYHYVDCIGFDEYIPKPLDIEKAITILPKVIDNLKFKKIKKQ